MAHPDGSAVAVWHRDCLVEAGSLADGRGLQLPNVVDGTPVPTVVEGTSPVEGCSGPAVFAPDGTAVAWTSGSDGQGRLYTAAWTSDGVDPDTIAAVGEDTVDLADTRLVGWDQDNRLLVRQRRGIGTQLYALQIARTEAGGAIAVGDFLVPAFDHLDGRVLLDTAADWLLEVREVVPDGSEQGVIDELGIRRIHSGSDFSYGNLSADDPIDPLSIWFDASSAETEGSIRVFGTGDGEGYWLGGDDSTLFGPFPIGTDVTAAAVVPGSAQLTPVEPAPQAPVTEATESEVPELLEQPASDGDNAPKGAPASAWCADRLLAAVITTASGSLEAMCGDGSTVPFGEGTYHHPSLGIDRLLVMQLPTESEAPPRIVSFDLATGESHVIADGSTPAAARNGAAAWLTSNDQIMQFNPGDGGQPTPIGPPLPHSGLMRLSWDRGGRWLFVSLGDPGGPLQVFALDTHDPAADWQPVTPEEEGTEIRAVAGETDTPDTAALLVRNPDGALTIGGAVLAEGSRTLPFPRVMDTHITCDRRRRHMGHERLLPPHRTGWAHNGSAHRPSRRLASKHFRRLAGRRRPAPVVGRPHPVRPCSSETTSRQSPSVPACESRLRKLPTTLQPKSSGPAARERRLGSARLTPNRRHCIARRAAAPTQGNSHARRRRGALDPIPGDDSCAGASGDRLHRGR